jgi:serine/threonine protein phosphatase 1
MKNIRGFVLGDVHGSFRALIQVLQRSGFDYENDKLICLGDVADGWPEVYAAVEELMKIRNLVYILGNHDKWALDWGIYGVKPEIWLTQGGLKTVESYKLALQTTDQKVGLMPESHIKFFQSAQVKYVEDNKLFVHGGIDPSLPLDQQDIDTLLWDRDLIMTAYLKGHNRPEYRLTKFDDIFVGHTTTEYRFKTDKPAHYCEVWDVDTGAGWSGKLTLMNIDTKEYFQSDVVTKLYPEEKGRGG